MQLDIIISIIQKLIYNALLSVLKLTVQGQSICRKKTNAKEKKNAVDKCATISQTCMASMFICGMSHEDRSYQLSLSDLKELIKLDPLFINKT